MDLAKMKFLAGEVKFPEQLQKAVGSTVAVITSGNICAALV